MFAAVHPVLANVAATIGVLAALVTAIGVLSKTPFGKGMRWLWRRVITEPISAWLRHTIAEVADESVVRVLMKPNGGKSLHDVATAVRRIEARQKRIEAHLGLHVVEESA